MSEFISQFQLAAIYMGVGQLEIKEVPVKEPRDDFCLIKVDRCGICGSDLHTFRGQSLRNTFQEWLKLGFADGHEYTGTVVSIGPGVKSIKPGKRVVVECTRHCGTCPWCKQGLYNICIERKDLVWRGHGGFAQYASAPEQTIFTIPENISAKQAALIEPSACALRAVNRASVALGDHVLVVGAGSIGMLCAKLAQIAGATQVFLACKYPHQREIAHSFGIHETLSTNNVPDEIADVAIDAVATSDSFNLALRAVKRGGTLVLVGSPTTPRTINLGTIVGKELNIKGSLTYAHQGGVKDFDRVINMISTGLLDPSPLVTHEFPLQQIETAFKTALDKNHRSIKVHVILSTESF